MTVTVVSVGWWYCNVRTVVFNFSSSPRGEEGGGGASEISALSASCLHETDWHAGVGVGGYTGTRVHALPTITRVHSA